jgi:hypothetical protein
MQANRGVVLVLDFTNCLHLVAQGSAIVNRSTSYLGQAGEQY